MAIRELQSVVIHGHEIRYRAGGEGPVVLLVHGMAGSSATWDPVFDRLTRHHFVIAPDLPGHGESDKPVGSDYSLGALASSLRDLLLYCGQTSATVVGHSLGGGIAMQFAYQFPSRCERLVLVGSGGLGSDVSPMLRILTVPGVEYLFPVLFASQLRDAGRWTFSVLKKAGLRRSANVEEVWRSYVSLTDPPTRAAFVRTLRSVVDTGGQHVSAHDRLPLAADIPTLIVWGDSDAIIPAHHAEAARETLPSSRVEIFEGSGHYPHCEDPARFAEVLDDFIATTEPGRASEEAIVEALAGR